MELAGLSTASYTVRSSANKKSIQTIVSVCESLLLVETRANTYQVQLSQGQAESAPAIPAIGTPPDTTTKQWKISLLS